MQLTSFHNNCTYAVMTLQEALQELAKSYTHQALADAGGFSVRALRNWLKGKTPRPIYAEKAVKVYTKMLIKTREKDQDNTN